MYCIESNEMTNPGARHSAAQYGEWTGGVQIPGPETGQVQGGAEGGLVSIGRRGDTCQIEDPAFVMLGLPHALCSYL